MINKHTKAFIQMEKDYYYYYYFTTHELTKHTHSWEICLCVWIRSFKEEEEKQMRN